MEHRVFIVVKRNNMFMSNEGVFTSESDADEFIRNRKALKDKDDKGCEFVVQSWIVQSCPNKERLEVKFDDDGYYYTVMAANGKKLTSCCFDWCVMYYHVSTIMIGYSCSEEDAYKLFWDEVKEYDKERYEVILEIYGSFNEALENGGLDDLRTDYLLSIYEVDIV